MGKHVEITRGDCFTITVHTERREMFLNVWTVAKSSKHDLLDICLRVVSVALCVSNMRATLYCWAMIYLTNKRARSLFIRLRCLFNSLQMQKRLCLAEVLFF